MTTPTKCLIMRLLAMRAENVDLSLIVAGLERFKAELEAQGIEVSITVKDPRKNTAPLIVLTTESEPAS